MLRVPQNGWGGNFPKKGRGRKCLAAFVESHGLLQNPGLIMKSCYNINSQTEEILIIVGQEEFKK